MKHVAPIYDAEWILGRVVEHFRQHPRRSLLNGGPRCAYRNGDDRCPVGVVIPEDCYKPEMEGNRVRDLLRSFPLPKWFKDNIDFLEILQTWHDKDQPFDEMMAELRAHFPETIDVQAAIV